MKLDHVSLRHGPAPATHSVGVRKPLIAVPLHAGKPGNVERNVEQDFGDVDAQFEQSDLVLERSFIGNEV